MILVVLNCGINIFLQVVKGMARDRSGEIVQAPDDEEALVEHVDVGDLVQAHHKLELLDPREHPLDVDPRRKSWHIFSPKSHFLL